MIHYVPVFSKIVDSSLWCEPDLVIKVFLTMLVKKDKDNIVRANAFNISLWSRKTEKEVLEAIEVLSNPDTRRIEPQPHEGRRIQKVEEGWLILNGQSYQDAFRAEAIRAKNARSQASFRNRQKGAK
jgi:hypothetical protein